MKTTLPLILFLSLACMSTNTHRQSQPKVVHHIKHQVVQKLKPVCDEQQCKGGYAYRDGSDYFYYYWMFNSSPELAQSYPARYNNMPSPSMAPPATPVPPAGAALNPYAQYGSTLPKGGTWSVRDTPSEDEALDDDVDGAVGAVDIEETPEGEPVTETVEGDNDPGGAPGGGDVNGPGEAADASASSGADAGGGSSGGDGGGGDGGGGD